MAKVLLLVLLVMIGPSLQGHIPFASPGWTAVEKSVQIPWDLEATPLQIKTDSTVGSGNEVYVIMYDKDGTEIGDVAVYFFPAWLNARRAFNQMFFLARVLKRTFRV